MPLYVSRQNQLTEQSFCTLSLQWTFHPGNYINLWIFLAKFVKLRNMHVFKNTLIVVHNSQITMLLNLKERISPTMAKIMTQGSNIRHKKLKLRINFRHILTSVSALSQHHEHWKGMSEIMIRFDVVVWWNLGQ